MNPPCSPTLPILSQPMSTLSLRGLTVSDAPAMTDLINSAFKVDHFFKYPEFYDRVNIPLLEEAVANKDSIYVVGTLPAETDPSLEPADSTDGVKQDVCTCVLASLYVEIYPEDLSVFEDKNQQNQEKSQEKSQEDQKKIYETLVLSDFLSQGSLSAPLRNPVLQSLVSGGGKYNVKFVTSISQVSVHPSKQGKGLGKQLILATEQYLLSLSRSTYSPLILSVLSSLQIADNCLKIEQLSRLEVLVAVRPELLGFYSKLGYVVVKENVPFSARHICLPEYNFTSTTMEKPIAEWDWVRK